jgi:hypothetical protein
MAQERRQEKSIAELRQQIAHSRDRLGRDLAALKYELDFPLKFRKSFQRNAKTWVTAAVLTGVVMTARAVPKRKTVVHVKSGGGQKAKGEEQKKGLLQAGLAMGLLRFAATMLRPVVMSMVTKRLAAYGARSAAPPPSQW